MSYTDQIKDIEKKSDFQFENYDAAIVLPPPNITGKLHIGHALNVFVQDLRVRFERFNGKNILWIPGTDHSGIATQVLVEKSIMPLNKYDLGREKFLEKVWEWKDKYQANIYEQLHSLGALLSWDHAKFTMDSDIQNDVSKAFCELYEAGLIYKAKKMIYWDTKLETAISDLEVKSVESKGSLFYIKYQLDNGSYITIATTRPETMFGDKAIAVNPKDDRYSELIGMHATIPLTSVKIPIIADERCEIEMGTGAVKITPAHDFLDCEIGEDHNLKPETIFNGKGELESALVPEKYLGLDRLKVRDLIVEDLDDHLEKVENIKNVVPFGDRSNSLLEPRLTDQWFINTDDLAQKALDALKEIKVFPEHFISVYKHWMNNIKPWCISRQLWWGHRIPVWYCGKEIIVAENKAEAEKKAKALGLNIQDMVQDSDVLDTWFSSALWPFSTLENNNLSPDYYPNDFLVTGSDILFFWVARMVMFGTFFKKKVPFKSVYLHGLVQDDFGKKMSKSKNNVVDPMDVVKKEGVDVLRFALLHSSIPGKNVKFGDKNLDHARHFCIKIWNLYQFTGDHVKQAKEVDITHVWNLWILNHVQSQISQIKEDINVWNLHQSSHKIYRLVWETFCSWYLEGAKHLLHSEYAEETKYTLKQCFQMLLIALNPFVPFISSYIYKDLFGSEILNEKWPEQVEQKEFSEITFVKNVVESIRFCKALFIIDKKPILYLSDNNKHDALYGIIQKMTKQDIHHSDQSYEKDYMPYPVDGGHLCVPIQDCEQNVIRDKFVKIRSEMEKNYLNATSKMNDDKFMSKAPEDVKEEMIVRSKHFSEELKKVDNITKMWENSL